MEINVLASGSRGNCSVLCPAGGRGPVALIDLGLSPRRILKHLVALGLTLEHVRDVLLTHLDSDHLHAGWIGALPGQVRVHLHPSHERAARCFGLPAQQLAPSDCPFAVLTDLRVRPLLVAHDAQGSCAFRIDRPGDDSAGHLGFATDLGHVGAELLDHLAGVDVLAIESNYCPRMQRASARPAFLKARIMGGSGHLSNEQSLEAIAHIAPRQHVVLLHLSQQCNDPALVRRLHRGRDYALSISDQFTPTGWIPVRPGPMRASVRPMRQGALFGHAGVGGPLASHPE